MNNKNQSIKFKFNNNNNKQHTKETQFTCKLHTHTHTITRLKEELYNNKLFESEGLRERKSANNEEEEE